MQRKIEFQEDHADAGQQAGAVGCAEFEHRYGALCIVMDRDLWRKGEVLELARHAALDDGRVVIRVAQGFGQALADLFDALGVVANRVAIVIEHDVGVEGELAAGRDDARVVDVQVELVHCRHCHGEEVVLVGGVDENLRAAFEVALGGFLD